MKEAKRSGFNLLKSSHIITFVHSIEKCHHTICSQWTVLTISSSILSASLNNRVVSAPTISSFKNSRVNPFQERSMSRKIRSVDGDGRTLRSEESRRWIWIILKRVDNEWNCLFFVYGSSHDFDPSRKSMRFVCWLIPLENRHREIQHAPPHHRTDLQAVNARCRPLNQ